MTKINLGAMDINDSSVIDILNNFIVVRRLTKIEILKMVQLAPVSKDINDLKENLMWESSKQL